MADDSFYQDGAGTQHPNFGTQEDPTPAAVTNGINRDGLDWQTALRPVSIRQLHDAQLPYTGADFTIDGKEVRYLTVVAHVVDEDVQDDGEIRKITYTLEDGTSKGRIKAFYQTIPEDPSPVFPISYARVCGTLLRPGRGASSRNCFKVNQLRAIVDPHEIYFHFLEVLTVTLIHERGPPPTHALPFLRQRSPDQDNTVAVETVLPPASTASSTTATSSNITSPGRITITLPPTILNSGRDVGGAQIVAEDNESPEEPPDSGSESSSGTSFKTAEYDDETLSSLNTPFAGLPLDDLRERDPYSHLTPMQRDILLLFYNADGDERSIYIGTIREGVGLRGAHMVTTQSLSEALDRLCDEGYIHPVEDNLSFYQLTDIPRRAQDSWP